MTMQSPLAVAIVPPVTTPGVTQEAPVPVSVVGGAISQLTQDVLAGPGSGSVPATVVGLQTRAVSALAPGAGDLLTWNGAAWAPAPPAPGGITQLTSDVTAGPGSGAQAATVQALSLGTAIPLTTAIQLGAAVGTYANFAFFRARSSADIIAANMSATGHTGLFATRDADGAVLIGSDSAGAKRAAYAFVANAVRVHQGNLANVASSGQFNGTDGGAVCFRNHANTTDIFALQKDTSDRVIAGDTNTAEVWAAFQSGGSLRIVANNQTRALLTDVNSGGFLSLDNVTAAPAASAIGAGIYSIAGALHGLGGGGTDTLLAPSEVPGFEESGGHCPECGTDFAMHWSNPKMGALTVCMWCLSDLLGDRPWIVRKPASK